MRITISNKILIEDISEELKIFLISLFKVPNSKFYEAKKAGRSIFGINKFIYNFSIIDDTTILIPRGYRKQLLNLELVKNEKNLKIIDKRSKFDKIEIDSSSIKYRKYQYDAVFSLFLNEEEGILVAPAGSGKTIIGLSLIPLFGQPTLWLTHTKPLAKQVFERVQTFLPTLKNDDVRFIMGGKWKEGKILTIALVQTLVRNIEKLKAIKNNFGLVIVDECHHSPSTTFTNILIELNPYYLFGLTATPYRKDKMENIMFQIIGPANILIPTDSVESSKNIIKPKIKYRTIVSKHVHDNNVQRLMKHHIIDNKKRNHIIVGDVIAEAVKNNFCLVASDRKIHCEILYNLISIGWEKTGIATGNYKDKHVQEQVEKFNNKEITVLITTYSLLGEGFDIPFLNRAFITTPFRNKVRTIQLIGRVQRSYPGKKDAVVFDYVDINIGVFKNQFFSKSENDSRYKTYESLGLLIEPYQQ
ncbi:MAG: DEAD/DEAH box helicase [Patescibacteria group bacterium]|nr:DEAD/DEAH box helicase [Patescibacteria group bacterium]